LELAVLSLEKYLILSTENNLHESSQLQLLSFLIEELQLLPVTKQAKHNSTNIIITAFLWQLTSSLLYKKLRELFISH